MEGLMKRINDVFQSLTDGLRTKSVAVLPSPFAVRKKYPMTAAAEKQILSWRHSIVDILNRRDDRFLVDAGPCSVHDEKAVLDYFRWVKILADRFGKKMLFFGRACYEKPRTRNGWEGRWTDPDGDDSYDLEKGIYSCRRFLAETARIGLPIAMEALDQNSEQFVSDYLSLAWIGARTTETKVLRRMVSAMSMPVGIKNSTFGDMLSAIDAIIYAQSPKAFPGLNLQGRLAAVKTLGNPDTFLILRGWKRPDAVKRENEAVLRIMEAEKVSRETIEKVRNLLKGSVKPNYLPEDIAEAGKIMEKERLLPKIVVDVSHDNAEKQHEKQIEVWKNVVRQRVDGNLAIRGAMLESYVKCGKQEFRTGFEGCDPGISITDACIGKEETEELLLWTYEQLS
jgi:3-deoxy-7-phosphoheptulonate synthase